MTNESPSGKAGDFDFLTGHWKVAHRRWVDNQWDAFEGDATVYQALDGIASVEELRVPSRNVSGMGLRLLDVERKLWADYWVNRQSGILNPPAWGSFTDGVGIWEAADGASIVRGVWDQITPESCRWHQAVSRDDGATWEESWLMQWLRP
jgi:hypothetical protein